MNLLTLALVIISGILGIYYSVQAVRSATELNILYALFFILFALYIYF